MEFVEKRDCFNFFRPKKCLQYIGGDIIGVAVKQNSTVNILHELVLDGKKHPKTLSSRATLFSQSEWEKKLFTVYRFSIFQYLNELQLMVTIIIFSVIT